MKTSELRIGNLVTVDNQDSWRDLEDIPLIVTAVNDKMDSQDLEFFPDSDGTVNLKSEYETYAQFSQFIKPIPLSEDILLKLGFNKDYKSGYIGIDVSNSDFVLTYPLKMGEWQKNFVFQFETGNVPKFKQIEYVHELQNLYFSLSGEELTIKE